MSNFEQAETFYDAVLATEKTGPRFVEASLLKGQCLFELGAKDPANYNLDSSRSLGATAHWLLTGRHLHPALTHDPLAAAVQRVLIEPPIVAETLPPAVAEFLERRRKATPKPISDCRINTLI